MKISTEETLALVEATAIEDKGIALTERLQKIEDGKAVRQARKWLQMYPLGLLGFEIIFLVYLIISQGIKRLLFTHLPFQLTEWEFAPFINIAIVQTFYLIKPIVHNLFPILKQEMSLLSRR